ncbi:unnamed protein product [Caenorhabditis auriculariae]|uniref:DAGKc domain-containing protein n=1 Tax=Caenorhabditis auriculariae TaxID=2777116 RepID=A0A8S1GVD6_9PELO|nr:unnamed protein product [Caenorhabditis auriculariae]
MRTVDGRGFEESAAVRVDLSSGNPLECEAICYELQNCRRQRVVRRLVYDSRKEAESFAQTFKKRSQHQSPPHLAKKLESRKVLVLVNPFSGQKNALSLWKKFGDPVLKDAGIEFDLVLTEYAGHATELLRELDIDRYESVLVNGGDGLVAEVLSGLLRREDKKRALNLPILHLPGGTSNALAAAVCFACNEPFTARDYFIRECTLFACRPRYMPLCLYKVDTEHDGVRDMFLSATWGLVADIDLASERFRWAGMIRLHMEATLRIMRLPSTSTYRAKISYVPVNNKQISQNTLVVGDKYTSGTEHPETAYEEWKGKVYPLSEAVDEKWTTIEGEWVMVNVTTCSHLGSDLPYLPTTKLSETIMYLTLIDWKTIKNRLEVALLFSTMNDRKHLAYPCFQVIPVRAVRVVPDKRNAHKGMCAIDGEAFEPGSSFQVYPSGDKATLFVVLLKEVTEAIGIEVASTCGLIIMRAWDSTMCINTPGPNKCDGAGAVMPQIKKQWVRGNYSREATQEPPWYVNILVQMNCYVMLFGAMFASWLQSMGIIHGKAKKDDPRLKNFAPLDNHFEAIYTNYIYRMSTDVVNRPICGVPGSIVRLKDRYTDDYGWTQK